MAKQHKSTAVPVPEQIKPKLLSVPDTARTLGLSEPLIWRWIAEGKLKSCKLGRRRLVSAASVDAMIEQAA